MEWITANQISLLAMLFGVLPGLIALRQNQRRDNIVLKITAEQADDFDAVLADLSNYEPFDYDTQKSKGLADAIVFTIAVTNKGIQTAYIHDACIEDISGKIWRPRFKEFDQHGYSMVELKDKAPIHVQSKYTTYLSIYMNHKDPQIQPKKLHIIDGEGKKWKGKIAH